jgi:DNA topoisomerase VI subunit A
MLTEVEHSLELMTKSDVKCAQQNKNIPAISQDQQLNRQNEVMLKKKRKGELEAFKSFGLPLAELKGLYINYLKIKASDLDVKVI